MNRVASIFGLTAMVFAPAAVGQVAVAPDIARTIEVELSEDGRIVAAPTLRVQFGRTAAVAVGPYSLRLRMERGSGPDGSPVPYLIRSSLYRSDGGATLVAQPSLTVLEGQQTRLRIAGQDGSDLSLAVIVR